MNDEGRAALARWLAAAAGADDLWIASLDKLSGGAIQENWGLTVEAGGKRQDWVLRTDAPSGVSTSHTRPQEFALLRVAHEAGVTVPEPLFLCEDASVFGKPFYVMARVAGRAEGHVLVRDEAVAAAGDALVERLGRELARIHAIRPPRGDLDFLAMPDGPPALWRIATYRRYLDAMPDPNPALEYALRWLERRAPESREITLCHSDFRTGNIMIDGARITGILDWEFAGWSDPMEDVAWFCARCWRFGAWEREAGGIGSREAFYRGYEAESGREIERAVIPYWEVMGAIRWAVIALQQGERHLTGGEESLELALTGLRAPEMELDALLDIAAIDAGVAA
ncbi:MAG: phosphotransferase family protein [Alphaproteobacteria bacterium]|nr:phosphotransferase family protein [Alphaproteobacteria bacterium]